MYVPLSPELFRTNEPITITTTTTTEQPTQPTTLSTTHSLTLNNTNSPNFSNNTMFKTQENMPSPADPSTTTTTTPTTPETLETDLLSHLASTSALDDIHTNLLCYLQRMGWTEKIRTLSLELLRAGRCERFDEVVDAVIASAECRPHPAFDLSSSSSGAAAATTNGGGSNGAGGNTGNRGTGSRNGMVLSADAEAYLENVDVRIPAVVVEHGVRMVKDVLRDVVVLEDGSSLDDAADGNSHHSHNNNSKGSHGHAGGGASGKKLDKEDSGDSSSKGKNGDASPVKKTGKKPNPGKNVK